MTFIPPGRWCVWPQGAAGLRGFTLIEVLVVVAVVGILVSIGLVNVFSARKRAQVARAQSELRTIAEVLLTYRLDQAEFPPMEHDGAEPAMYLSGHLTTPVAYLTNHLLEDAFPTLEVTEMRLMERPYLRRYRYLNVREMYDPAYTPPGSQAGLQRYLMYKHQYGGFMISSNGPDGRFNTDGREAGYYTQYGLPWACVKLYDPTNGVSSTGNIVRSEKYPAQPQEYDLNPPSF